MKKIIPLLLLLIIACDKDLSLLEPFKSDEGILQVIIGSDTTRAKSSSAFAIDQLEVRLYNSKNSLIRSKFLSQKENYFTGEITVKAQNDLKLLCIGADKDTVKHCVVVSNIDVKKGKTTSVEIDRTKWNKRFIPDSVNIAPEQSTGEYTVSWTEVANATKYILQEASNPEFTGP